jgi:hypothetical protein
MGIGVTLVVIEGLFSSNHCQQMLPLKNQDISHLGDADLINTKDYGCH